MKVLIVLERTGTFLPKEIVALDDCWKLLNSLPREKAAITKSISSAKDISLFKNVADNGYIGDGYLKYSKSRLYTFGVNTCVLLILFGKDGGALLQHLSGWNFPGNPLSHIPRDLKLILPNNFELECGYIIPGGALNDDLMALEIPGGEHEVTMALLLWEQIGNFFWKNKLVIVTNFNPRYKIEVFPSSKKIVVWGDPAIEAMTVGRRF